MSFVEHARMSGGHSPLLDTRVYYFCTSPASHKSKRHFSDPHRQLNLCLHNPSPPLIHSLNPTVRLHREQRLDPPIPQQRREEANAFCGCKFTTKARARAYVSGHQ